MSAQYLMQTTHKLSTLADRVWYAVHCLPRDAEDRPPSLRSLEIEHEIALATLSKIIKGQTTVLHAETLRRLAQALNVPSDWLLDGGDDDAPEPTGDLPGRVGMRGGKVERLRYRDAPGWEEAVAEARQTKTELPPGAYVAGGEALVLWRVAVITASIAHGISEAYYASLPFAARRRYAMLESRERIATKRAPRPKPLPKSTALLRASRKQ